MNTLKTNQQILNLFLGALILLVIIFLFDRSLGALLKKYYFSQQSGPLYRATYAIDSTLADILVFGSSRANYHYVPDAFEKRLNMSFYNTGRDGNTLLYNYSVFLCATKRYIPRIVILDITPDDLYFDQRSYDHLSSLLPYYKYHSEIRPVVELRSPYEKFKLFSETYPFNSLFLTIIAGNLDFNKKRKVDFKGYVPLTGMSNNLVFSNLESDRLHPDREKIKSLTSILELCRRNNIKIFLVQSPVYGRVKYPGSYELLDSITRKFNIEFWDYSNVTTFSMNPGYFYDASHLNHQGAVLFSKLISERIYWHSTSDSI